MKDRDLAVVVLAAGQGTRMRSDLPKVLHKIAGEPMLRHVLAAVESLTPNRVVVVVGPDMDAVSLVAAPHVTTIQAERLGTGHAARCAVPHLVDFAGLDCDTDVLVVFGDTPLLTGETLQRLLARRRQGDAPAIVGLAFRPEDPAHYGRVLLDENQRVDRIVEFADANREERSVNLCNAGPLIGDAGLLMDLLGRLEAENAQGEYYLTDIYALAREVGQAAGIVEADARETMGVNSKTELAEAEHAMQGRLRRRAMEQGVTLIDPASVWLSADTEFGRDVIVEPNVVIGTGVRLGDRVEVRSFSHLEGADVASDCRIGPYARLRPGSALEPSVRIGNFVEIKNATLGFGAKVNHLSYVGDSRVGENANIGAGTITCNYDGFSKHRTEIGAGAFIGSNTALVAPVSIGTNVIVGAGSTITNSVAAEALTIARGRQQDIPGGAQRLRKSQAAAKRRADEKNRSDEKNNATVKSGKSAKQES